MTWRKHPPLASPRRAFLGFVLLALAWLGLAAAPALASTGAGLSPLVYYGGLDGGSTVFDNAQYAYTVSGEVTANSGTNLYLGQTDSGTATTGQSQSSGWFDWLTDLFDWFEDKTDELTGNKYDDAGIPHDAFSWSYYGMNVQKVESMSVSDFVTCLTYTGPWLRINMSTDEVAEENWYRLEPALRNLRTAANSTGIDVNLVINLSGYSNYTSGDDYLLRNLSWQEKGDRYGDLAFELTEKVHSLGWGDAIIEAWNEPDNSNYYIGIGPSAGSSEFKTGMVELLTSFSDGVHAAGGVTAFSPFMTLNDTKIDTVRSVWKDVESGFDYFSAHYYDDDPGKARYWAKETRRFTGDRPVIISEIGFQSSPKDADKYRRMCWALYQGFGSDTLKGVMGYVYASDHQPWTIDKNEDFFWKVTHDSRP